MKTDWWDRAATGFLIFSVIAVLATLIYAMTLPSDPNAKVCPVISNIAICEGK